MASTLNHALPVALALLGAAQVLASGHRAAQLTMPEVETAAFYVSRGDTMYRVTLISRQHGSSATCAAEAPGGMPNARLPDLPRDADAAALRSQAMAALAGFAARDAVATERHLRAALRNAPHDACLLSAYADFLLDEGRTGEVEVLLRGREDVDGLLLRQALALRWQGDALALAPVRARLQARFAAAARHGDGGDLCEQARFTLHVLGNSSAALALARRNWQMRRGRADARILLEAAIAAQDSAALLPVLRWLHAQSQNGIATAS